MIIINKWLQGIRWWKYVLLCVGSMSALLCVHLLLEVLNLPKGGVSAWHRGNGIDQMVIMDLAQFDESRDGYMPSLEAFTQMFLCELTLREALRGPADPSWTQDMQEGLEAWTHDAIVKRDRVWKERGGDCLLLFAFPNEMYCVAVGEIAIWKDTREAIRNILANCTDDLCSTPTLHTQRFKDVESDRFRQFQAHFTDSVPGIYCMMLYSGRCRSIVYVYGPADLIYPYENGRMVPQSPGGPAPPDPS